ncbi:MAG: hypothetical protein AAF628_23570, partial [Planctomycetota bacterium]
GQLRWDPAPSPISPAPRWGHAMERSGFLFGGRDEVRAFGDTWVYDRIAGWQVLAPESAGPPTRHGHAMDAGVGVVWMFGGADAVGGLYDDTWAWDGTTWQELAPANAPSPREGHGVAFDYWTSTTVLLFGGRTDAGFSDETWLFDGTNWVRLQPEDRPPARAGHQLFPIPIEPVAGAPFTRDDAFLLIGGADQNGARSDSWLYYEGNWSPFGAAPVPVADAAAEFLGFERRRHVFFGGTDAAGNVRGDLYERPRDARWLPQTQVNSIPARADAALSDVLLWGGIHGSVQGALLFGGRDASGQALGDTWHLVPDHIATSANVGVGCGPGAWGNTGPDVFLRRVIAGNTETVTVYTRSSEVPVVVGVGVGHSPVPATCGIHINPLLVFAGVTQGPIAATVGFPLPVPFAVGVAGAELELQTIALEPAASQGVAISDVLQVQIGS